MPYIDKDRRYDIDIRHHPLDAGELNYCITRLILEANEDDFPDFPGEEIEHVVRNYIARKGLRYANVNEAIGVLICAGLEFKRRTGRSNEANNLSALAIRLYGAIAAPYEDQKIIQNGDIDYV